MRRFVTALAVSTIVCFAPIADPFAGGAGEEPGYVPPPTGAGRTTNGTPEAIAVNGASGPIASYRRPGRGRGGPRWTCRYYLFSGGLSSSVAFGADRSSPPPAVMEPGSAYWLECVDENDEITYSMPVVWDPTNPLGGIAAGPRAAEEALQALPLANPTIHTNPPEGGELLVGIDTWFRVDTVWQPRQATAAVSLITATVTATPTRVEWDLGDGSPPLVCDGPGDEFTAATDPSAESACAHVYTHRSGDPPRRGDVAVTADGRYLVTATVTYEVSWTATNGTGGTLDPVTRTGTAALLVVEAQALIR